MNKITLPILFLSILLSGFSDNQVWVKAKMPAVVYAGDRFTIEIVINKLDLQHFAEFKQNLPEGFTAIEKQSGSANFSFKNQVVKFTWVRLPRTPIITLTYDVLVRENIQGLQTLSGEFTYIYKNERGTAELTNDKLNVVPKTGRTSNLNSGVSGSLTFPPNDPKRVQCLRVKPQYIDRQNAYFVKLLVSFGNVQDNVRIEENLPYGYSAGPLDGKGATFLSENNKAEFIWKKLPDQKNIEISYKLIPVTSNRIEPALSGNLIYFIDGRQLVVPVQQVNTN